MEVVEAIIHDQDLPMYLWEEATIIEVYIHNKISHSSLGNKTLEEMFSGENPEVSHLIYLVLLCIVTFPRRKDRIYILQERRYYS